MLTYVLRRAALSIPVLVVASILVFVFVSLTSDPLARFAQNRDPNTRVEAGLRADIYQEPCHFQGTTSFGTPVKVCSKTPLYERYWHWATKFARGQMGTSFVTGHRVSTDLWTAFKNTVQLIFFGSIIAALIAIAIGVFSAVRQYSTLDYAFTGLSFIGLSMPPFWFGLIAIQFFTITLSHWVGSSGPLLYSIGIHSHRGAGLTDYARHLVLPVMTLTVQIIAEWSRYQRSSMLDVMSSDYIRTARAKGLKRSRVVFKHALRNALIPLVTVMAVDIGALFGGLLVTEQIFSWPGMGQLFLTSLDTGDTNVLLPWLMVTAVFIVGFNLLADLLYATLDPRIRLA